MTEIYKGRGNKKEQKHMLEVLDDVFFTAEGLTFKKLLPKLYKDKYNPANNNFIVKEDDEIMAAVGLYYNKLNINGTELSLAGIGNVAVSKKARSKGYMKDCMNLSVEDMLEKGVDIAELGGQRQRYQYFSFEACGKIIKCNFYIGNMRHTYGKDVKTKFKLKKLKSSDNEYLEKIAELNSSGKQYVERPVDEIFDILCSWRHEPYVLLHDDEFKGYVTFDKTALIVTEFQLVNRNDIKDLILAAFDILEKENISVRVMEYDADYLNYCTDICENVTIHFAGNFAIYNFEKVVREFLKLKATYQKLCNASIVVYIHGYAKEELIEIKVKDNDVSVFSTNKEPDISLDYFDAIKFFFGFSDKRNDISPETASLFPLPLDFHDADRV